MPHPELRPHRHDGVHVFVVVPPGTVLDVTPVVSVEDDGDRTVVVRADDARRLGLDAGYPCAWITLPPSTPTGVGPLARATAALVARGIGAHPVAGSRRDHLFVPHDRAAEAMAVLDPPTRRPAVVLGGFELDEDPARVDRDVVWDFLSTEAYWARWRTRAELETQLDRAWRVVAAYRRSTGALVGFARAVSDGVSFGYLADVFVLRAARGVGLGPAMVAQLTDDPRVRWVLFTADAHGLYERFGFAAPDPTCLVRPAHLGGGRRV